MSIEYPGAVEKDQRTYMTILGSDGSLRIKVDENTEGAVKREWEKDGKTGVKYEKVFTKVVGRITNLEMYEGEFGNNLLVTLTKDGRDITLSISVNSPYGEDFLKKAPAIDLEKDVEISPYCFDDDNGKTRKGVIIKQDDQKLVDFFKKKEGDKWVHLHGLPEPKGDVAKYNSDKWTLYYGEVRVFLTDYFEEKVMPKMEKLQEAGAMVQADKVADDIPL